MVNVDCFSVDRSTAIATVYVTNKLYVWSIVYKILEYLRDVQQMINDLEILSYEEKIKE